MNNVVFVAGWPASGKSVAKNDLTQKLTRDGRVVTLMTDKEALLSVVEQDMKGRRTNPDGSVESPDTILVDPTVPRESWGMIFKTPRALNSAHEEMFGNIARFAHEQNSNHVLIAEIAYGKDQVYGNETLRQSAGEFLQSFKTLGIINHALVLDIYAEFDVRRQRNLKRSVGFIPDAEFTKYFPDEGAFGLEERRQLNGRYSVIDNTMIMWDDYIRLIDFQYRKFILPGIKEGNSKNVEDFSSALRRDRR